MSKTSNAHYVFLALCAVFLAAGCDSGPTGKSKAPHFRTKGSLVDNGNPVKPDEKSSISITFSQIVEKGTHANGYSTSADPTDGTFEVKGSDDRGMPLGKYRVKLTSLSMNPSPHIKMLNQRFGSDASPIIIEVVDEKTPIVIDIAKYKK